MEWNVLYCIAKAYCGYIAKGIIYLVGTVSVQAKSLSYRSGSRRNQYRIPKYFSLFMMGSNHEKKG